MMLLNGNSIVVITGKIGRRNKGICLNLFNVFWVYAIYLVLVWQLATHTAGRVCFTAPPSGFVLGPQNDRHYRIYRSVFAASWPDADDVCRSQGSLLAMYKTPTEMEDIKYFSETYSAVWIGVQNLAGTTEPDGLTFVDPDGGVANDTFGVVPFFFSPSGGPYYCAYYSTFGGGRFISLARACSEPKVFLCQYVCPCQANVARPNSRFTEDLTAGSAV